MINPNSIDLNLLRVFDALARERSVSAAAARLGLSQPTVSNALRRLRDVAGDPLFVRTRHGMEPTATALLLRDPIQQGLATIRAGLAQGALFDPATARRTFTLLMNDVGASSFLPPLLRRIAAAAPGVDLTVMERDHQDYEDALDSGEADLAVGRVQLSESFRSALVIRSVYVVILRRDHPALTRAGRLSLAGYLGAPHIVVSPRGATGNPVERVLAGRGLRRRVALSVPHVSALASILPESDLIATVPDRCVDLICRDPRLRWNPLPFEVPPNLVYQWWHKRHENDPGHRWLRGLFVDV